MKNIYRYCSQNMLLFVVSSFIICLTVLNWNVQYILVIPFFFKRFHSTKVKTNRYTENTANPNPTSMKIWLI